MHIKIWKSLSKIDLLSRLLFDETQLEFAVEKCQVNFEDESGLRLTNTGVGITVGTPPTELRLFS